MSAPPGRAAPGPRRAEARGPRGGRRGLRGIPSSGTRSTCRGRGSAGGCGRAPGAGPARSEGRVRPSCFLKVSRLEAQLLLERYPECGNLLLRPSGDGTGGVSVTTRQTLNGCACAAPGWAEGRCLRGAEPEFGGAWDPEAGPSPEWGVGSTPGGGAKGRTEDPLGGVVRS